MFPYLCLWAVYTAPISDDVPQPRVWAQGVISLEETGNDGHMVPYVVHDGGRVKAVERPGYLGVVTAADAEAAINKVVKAMIGPDWLGEGDC